MNDYSVSLGVILETDDLQRIRTQINSIEADPIKVHLDISNVQSQINSIRTQLQNLSNIKINLMGAGFSGGANSGFKGAVNEANWAYRQMLDIQRKANSLSLRINGLDTSKNVNELQELSLQFARLRSDYETLKSTFGTQLSTAQFGNLQAEIDETNAKLSAMDAKFADTRANLAAGIQGNLGQYNNQVLNLEGSFNRLETKPAEVAAAIETLKQSLMTLQEADETEAIIAANERYKMTLQQVTAMVNQLAIAEKNAADPTALAQGKEAALLRLNGLFEQGSAASRRFGGNVEELRRRINACGSVTGLKTINKDIAILNAKVEQSNLQTQTFITRFKTQLSQYSMYFSGYMVFMYAIMAMRDMFEQVKLIDSAMTELKKVTDETAESYNNFLTNAATRAREIGTTIDGLVESTADFARLGYEFADAQGLAEVANIYAVVGDEIEDVDQATKSLISTMAAFKNSDAAIDMSNSDFAMSIIDKFNEVGNNFAISSGGIGVALEKSASSLDAANNTLDESIALITAANTVVQNPDVVGTAFKTISMRIRGAKTELEEAGLETDGMVESTAKLREEILALSGVDIMLNENTFKSTYQIMDELAAKWEDLTDIQQATITELVAGKRQGNIVSSLMTNFDIARDTLKTSLESSGSALQEHEKWQQSLESQINKVKAAWQGLSQAFLKSDFLKKTLDAVIKLLDGLTKLFDTFGVLPTLLGGFLGYKGISSIIKHLPVLIKAFRMFGALKVMGLLNVKNVMTELGILFPRAAAGLAKVSGAFTKVTASSAAAAGSTSKFKSVLSSGNVYIAAAVIAIIALTAAFSHQKKKAEELSQKVGELTDKYREQHGELKKLQGDYDTTNEDSMISKYERLSKGVDGLGRNVSLTAEEYSEYQDIVNKIAEQIPSLVSGYDEQGNALLSVKGNVDELVAAYERLIHAENRAILTGSGDIQKDFENTLENASGEGLWSNNHGFWAEGINLVAGLAFNLTDMMANRKISGAFMDFELKENTIQGIEDLMAAKSEKEKDAIVKNLMARNRFAARELEDALTGAGIEVGFFESPFDVLEKTIKDDPQQIKNIIDNYYAQFDEAVEKEKSIATAKLSEAFDVSNELSGLNYGNISEELQAIAYQTVNSLDLDFFSEISESGKTVEQWTTEMLNQLNAISKEDSKDISMAFDLQTQFNGGEISYGEYVDGLTDTGKLIKGLGLDERVESQLLLSLGLDEKGIVEEYQHLKNSLADDEFFNIMPNEYESFLRGLSVEEHSVLIDIIPELKETEYKETLDDIEHILRRELILKGLTFDLDLEVESTGIEALNTALAESVSATGLSSESIAALKGRYSELESQGYDLTSMFEETSNGIHINRNELGKLEKAYASQKLDEVNSDLAEMQVEYDKISEELKTCSNEAKAGLYNDQLTLAQKISEAATLASQYEGLTSAYNDWLSAEEAGQERDMYEKVLEGFENIGDEISRGWLDDGTIEFLKLLKGDKATIVDGNGTAKEIDIATASAKDLKKVWQGLDNTIKHTTYSVKDFFTVDEDGNSTSKGVYNFLDAIGQLEEEKFGGKDVVKRDKDGKVISFDFELAGGDEVIAEALGISEELVQIMLRAADDAGFVISLDGAYKQLADLQNEAKAAANTLKELGLTDFEFDFNTSNVEDLETQFEEAKKIWQSEEFWTTTEDGKRVFNFDVEGATEAMQVVSTLRAKLDKLTQEKYGIGLTVEDEEFEEPLENLQEYGRKIATLNQLELNPQTNSEEIEKVNGELDKVAEYFANLEKDTKIKLGFEADDDIEDVKKKIESGEIKIPTVLDIQTNIDKNIETLADLALLNSGLLSDNEETVIRQKYKVEIEEEVHGGSGGKFGLHGGSGGKFALPAPGTDGNYTLFRYGDAANRSFAGTLNREASIKIIASTFGIEDVEHLSSKLEGLDDKTVDAIAEVIGKIEVDELRQAIALLTPEEVEVIANAIGKGDVAELSNVIGQLNPKTVDAIANALGYDDVNALRTAVEGMDGNTVQAVAEALGITDVESLQTTIDNMHGNTVDATVNTDGQAQKVWSLQSVIDGLTGKVVNITLGIKKAASSLWNYITGNKGSTRNDSNGYGGVNGTANVNGTTGVAYVRGDWRTKKSQTALTGELGRELVVTGNRWYTVGDNGAEFANIPKGSIIFNHRQTEEIFKHGKVTSDGGRGKALVGGTALLEGTAYKGSSGSGGGIDVEVNNYKVGSNPSSKYEKNEKDEKEEFKETLDWAEIALSRIEREIDRLDKKANSSYKSWSERNKALVDEISKVGDEIELQQSAYDRYMQKANNVGLSESWAKKVRDGSLNIDDFEGDNNEALVEKIKEYQEWYEKALDCQDAIDDLKEKEAELYKQRFDNVSAQYEGDLGVIEHEKNMLDEHISQAETQGHLVSKSYYEALMGSEIANQAKLVQKRADLMTELAAGLASGKITKDMEIYDEMVADIDATTLAIEESNTALLEYEKTLQQLDWEVFDLLQERISNITEEADFLIELMSNNKLYDDSGKLTDEGMATVGLHGQNYNTYMHQADYYGEEAAKLDREISRDPYDQELIARRDEMLAQQREMILAAEDEKQAIKDLVEEGINVELDALQERIDKYNESLDAAKDLYDYNKRVKEQTEEIASLEKQMAAYQGDDSEESKAKIQELKVALEDAKDDLEETEYDKYISDQKQLLDELYLQYEMVLNQRLDNTDALIAEVVAEVNANAGTISATISEESANVGYTLSEEMRSIWNENAVATRNVITMYGENFSNAQTTTNQTLGRMELSIQAMVSHLNAEAAKKAAAAAKSSAAAPSSTAASTKPKTESKPATTTSGGDGKARVGDKVKFVSGQYYYDSYGTKPLGSQERGNYVYITYVNEKGSHPYHISRDKDNKRPLGWLKLNQISGYATGKQNFLEDEAAWTQEEGREFIVRPSDGAILTPIAKGDSVLNATASGNIWNMANSPAEFIKDNLNLGGANVPNNSNVQNSYTQHLDKVVFNLPNVKNYDELLSAMQKDKNFERLVESLSIGKLSGGSSLAKGKAIR
jgi:TP901 family phage tail tape measure protein